MMFNDDAAPVNGLRVEDGRGDEPPAPPPAAPVPDRPVPTGAGAVPVPAGAPVAEGMGNGGATVAEEVTVAGPLETSTEAVVSVAAGGGALVADAVVKSSGSSTPLSMAQVLGSTPSGQQ